MATKRTERLARAIEALSARDMVQMVDYILEGYAESNKHVLTRKLLLFAANNQPTHPTQEADK